MGFKFYPHNHRFDCNAMCFDKVYVSMIFDTNQDKVKITGCEDIDIGGIGSVFPTKMLPREIDSLTPWYFPNEDTSYGYVTRGCIRNCYFCKVPKYEGKVRFYCPIEDIVKHDRVILYDNNILAFPGHKDVLRYLVEKKVKVRFKAGLDFRLLDDENAELLSKLKYDGSYEFAFDDISYLLMWENKIELLKKWFPKKWKVTIFVYFNANDDIHDLIFRCKWIKDHECLPYVMRDRNCYDIENENLRSFIIDWTAYCNQPRIFKNVDFDYFLGIYYKNERRHESTMRIFKENWKGDF